MTLPVYYIWNGRAWAKHFLAILFICNGLLFLLGSGLAGSLPVFAIAFANLVAVPCLYHKSVIDFQKYKRAKMS